MALAKHLLATSSVGGSRSLGVLGLVGDLKALGRLDRGGLRRRLGVRSDDLGLLLLLLGGLFCMQRV